MASKRRLPAAREDEIAEFAEFVADDSCPTGIVDPEKILKRNGISFSYGNYGDAFDGMLECKNRRFHVYCNTDRESTRGSARARFTLAHELGHYFIDEHRNALLSGVDPHYSQSEYESGIRVEMEADAFASNLLLPRGRFLAEGKRAPRGLAGVIALSRHFETSITATAIRYAREELVPCTIIKWDEDGVGWKWFSSETFRAGFRKTIETRDDLPSDSATELAFSRVVPANGEFHQCGSTASLWFPFLAESSSRSIILREEAVSLGRFGVLTFLHPDNGTYRPQW